MVDRGPEPGFISTGNDEEVSSFPSETLYPAEDLYPGES